MDPARKAYSQYSGDKESTKHVYQGRRFHINQQLPNLKGYELAARIENLNIELSELKGEIGECESAIHQLKHEKDPKALRHKFRISYPINARPKDIIERFKNEVEWRKKISYWIRRERQIYVFERQKRRLAAAKLPIIKRQRTSLNQKAHKLLCKMRSLSLELAKLREDYQKTYSEHYGLGREIELLSFDREGLPEGRLWTNFSIPSEAIQKLNKNLETVDLEEQKKGLRKLLRLNRVE